MLRSVIGLLLLIPATLFAQSEHVAERELSDRLPDRFFIDLESLRSEILSRVPPSPVLPGFPGMEKRNARRNLRFADHQAFSISELLTSGYIYSDWDELEGYLNEVLKKVIPPELPDGDKVHAYLVRNASFNASMSSSGYMFFNIGTLPELYDESMIAALLCHELAHFHLNHGFKKYYGHDVGAYAGNIGEIKASEESVQMEVQADSLAMVWLERSDYDLKGFYELLNVIERMEKQDSRLHKAVRWRVRPTHPGATERLAAFKAFYEAHQEDSGSSFLVDSRAFARLRQACKPEVLRVQLQRMDYSECIRNAFNFHLFEPDEPLYVWYLMEAIRRACYLDVEMWDRKFIMDKFTPVNAGAAQNEAQASAGHLFTAFDTDVMCIPPQMFRQIQARFYWTGELKFVTYAEAYDFFARLGGLLGCSECTLSQALRHNGTPAIRDSLLQSYIQGEAKYKEFAEAMLAGNVRAGFGPGKLLVFCGIDAFVRQGRDVVPVRVTDDNEGSQFNRLADTLTVMLQGRRVTSLPAERMRSLERYLRLNELKEFASYPTFARGERTELHVLDPRYYELFKGEQVDEIEFVECEYGELRDSERSVEAYEEAATTDYQSIFDQTNGSRYVDVYVSSLREVPKSPMKLRYHGDERSMKNKVPGYLEILWEIKRAIAGKDERLRQILIYVYQ